MKPVPLRSMFATPKAEPGVLQSAATPYGIDLIGSGPMQQPPPVVVAKVWSAMFTRNVSGFREAGVGSRRSAL
ncbi:MAG: hypothetical protein E6J41_25280 [Chloroflexi bacterium]|nr:MAG: hypothetical protein E6J41_25280 [Chloroflexota bacterium]